jgi:hypothetical protein
MVAVQAPRKSTPVFQWTLTTIFIPFGLLVFAMVDVSIKGEKTDVQSKFLSVKGGGQVHFQVFGLGLYCQNEHYHYLRCTNELVHQGLTLEIKKRSW